MRLIILFHSDSGWYGNEECLGVCRTLCRKQRLNIDLTTSSVSIKVADVMEGQSQRHMMTLSVYFSIWRCPLTTGALKCRCV